MVKISLYNFTKVELKRYNEETGFAFKVIPQSLNNCEVRIKDGIGELSCFTTRNNKREVYNKVVSFITKCQYYGVEDEFS